MELGNGGRRSVVGVRPETGPNMGDLAGVFEAAASAITLRRSTLQVSIARYYQRRQLTSPLQQPWTSKQVLCLPNLPKGRKA
jgi:hypothetical protein